MSTGASPRNKKDQENELLHAITSLFNTGLDRNAVAVLTDLLQFGIHPESLADGGLNGMGHYF